MTYPRGAGICSPLESGIEEEAARTRLQAAFSINYQPTGQVSMLRARDYGTPAWADRVAYVKATGAFTLIFNEPENGWQDNLPPKDAAKICREWQYNTLRRDAGGSWRVTAWGGPNVMMNELGNGERWMNAYLAAGGRVPPVVCVHWYGYGGDNIEAHWDRTYNYLDKRKILRPVLVTELGLWPPVNDWKPTVTLAAGVLEAAHEMVEKRRILGYAWFSSRYPGEGGVWAANDLLRADGSLTPLGAKFVEMNG